MLLLGALLVNLLAVGYVTPPSEVLDRDLPMAAHCQGGGPGCVEQPLIPPPSVGLPRFSPSAPVVYVLVELTPPASSSPFDAAPDDLLRPPVLNAA